MSQPADSDADSGGRVATFTARWLVRLRWFVIGFWALACLGSLFVLPSLSESQGGATDLKGLLPADTPAVTNEVRSFEIFGLPLLARTAVVQRDADGLTVFDQARTVVNALAVQSRDYKGPGTGRMRW